jgi:cobalt-zinc-cadmium efflux system outer membrane protein
MFRGILMAIAILSLIGHPCVAQAVRRKPAAREQTSTPGRASMRSTIPAIRTQPVVQVAHQEPVPAAPADQETEAAPVPTSVGRRISLSELQDIALQWNPTLAQAAAGVESERGSYQQVGLYPNPQVGYLNNSASPSSAVQSNGVFLSQEFVTANKLKLARVWEGHELNRIGWEAEAQRIRVLNDLEIRYYEVLGAQQTVFAAQTLEKVAERGLTTAETLFENKEGAKGDVLQATIQLETVRVNKEDALYRHHAAWQQLANVVGDPGLQPALLDGTLEGDVPTLDFEQSLEELLANSPQITSSQAALDHARAEWQLARAQAIPNVTLQVVLERDNATKSTQASTLVALPVPLFNRNQGNVYRTMADIRAAEAEISRVKLVLRDLLAESFRRYRVNRLQVERFRDKILPAAEENMELASVGYQSGERSFLEVLTARQTYFQAKLAYVESWTELRKAIVEIEGLQLTGGLNPAEIGAAIQAVPGGGAQRQRALLNKIEEAAARQLLPAAQLGR